MGHKVHPIGFRLGIVKTWESRWYAGRNYKDLFTEDRKLREAIRKRLFNASISRIEIERVAGTQISIAIHTAKPGIVIGKNGESVERTRQELERLTKKKIRLSILEIRNPEVDATLVARSIAEQLEKRISFRRAMKQSVQRTMRAGAKGIKVVMGGRLGGAEIARTEKEVAGSVPLQTLRADIDYSLAEAHTTYGRIGIKVWIYHGDVLPNQKGAAGSERRAVPAAVPQDGERGGRGDGRGDGRGGERGGRGGERGDDRRPRTGAGERTGAGPRRSGPASPTTGIGGGARTPRTGTTGARGGTGTRTPRPPRAPSGEPSADGTADTPAPITAEPSGPAPQGTIPAGAGSDLPSSGPVTPTPAPTANAPENPTENPTAPPRPEPESDKSES